MRMRKGSFLAVIDSPDSAFDAFGKGNFKEALPFLMALADADDVHALSAVAWMNETGAGTPRNLEFAKLCYERAVDLGSADAMYRLGRVLCEADDLDGALAMFGRGAAQEHLPSMSALGMLLVKVAKTAEETRIGMKWLHEAADRGHLYAKKKIVSLKLEESDSIIFALRMTAELIKLRYKCMVKRRKDKYSDEIL